MLLATTAGAAVAGVEARGVVRVVTITSPSPTTFAVPLTTSTETVLPSVTVIVVPWGTVEGPLLAVRTRGSWLFSWCGRRWTRPCVTPCHDGSYWCVRIYWSKRVSTGPVARFAGIVRDRISVRDYSTERQGH